MKFKLLLIGIVGLLSGCDGIVSKGVVTKEMLDIANNNCIPNEGVDRIELFYGIKAICLNGQVVPLDGSYVDSHDQFNKLNP